MAKFTYTMENILKIKTKIEEQKRMELGKAMMAYQEALDEQLKIEGILNDCINDFVLSQKQAMVVSEFQRLNQSVNFYEKALVGQKKNVNKANNVVNVKREALKKALEEKKIQEKLKEKALEDYMEEEKIEEHKRLDEIVGYRYTMNTNEE